MLAEGEDLLTCRIEEMLAARMKKVNISMLDKLLSICYALMLHWPAAGGFSCIFIL